MRPNLLFIMTDDQASWTLGSVGHPNAHTPVLDRLAADGAVLHNLLANAAICSPSRGCLLTGCYPTEAGFGPDGEVWLADEQRHVDPSMPSWPRCLREHGYRTALIGKWGCGNGGEEQHPTRNGYERFRGGSARVSRDPEFMIDGKAQTFPGAYSSDVLADLAIDTIREWRAEPFALSLHYWAPHANVAFPEGYRPPYPDRDPHGKPNRSWLPMAEQDLAPWQDMDPEVPEPDFPNQDHAYIQRMLREYLASVHSVDRTVGRILQVLDELGLADNTIVVFTSDQGYSMGHHGLWHKGNGWWTTRDGRDPNGVYTQMTRRGIVERENLYDTALRVPGIVRWPSRIRPGTEIDQTVSFIDWFPTLLDMTGASTPADTRLPGKSVLPLLDHPETPVTERPHIAQHHKLRCIRTAGWKYVLNRIDNEPDELYDLDRDPEEQVNLIAHIDTPELQAIHRDLEHQLLTQMRHIRDPLLEAMP